MQQQDQEEDQGLFGNWMYDEKYNKDTEYVVNKMKFTEPETIKTIYKLMKNIDEILVKNNIQYWGSYGTALGCIRHKGIIPWDDDLDISLKDTDEEKFTSQDIRQQFKQKGILISKIFFGYKIFFEQSKTFFKDEKSEEYGFPFCDVFLMTQNKNQWQLKDKDYQEKYYKEVYSLDQINNIQRKQFGDFQINVCGDVEKYLKNEYGGNWATEAKTHYWDHVREIMMKPEIFKLTDDLLKPALPFQ